MLPILALLVSAVAVTARPAAGNNILTRALALEARQGLSSLLPEACSTECTTLNTAYAGCHTGDMATCTTMCETSAWADVESCVDCAVAAGNFTAEYGTTVLTQLQGVCGTSSSDNSTESSNSTDSASASASGTGAAESTSVVSGASSSASGSAGATATSSSSHGSHNSASGSSTDAAASGSRTGGSSATSSAAAAASSSAATSGAMAQFSATPILGALAGVVAGVALLV
ncbi:uncharacterized protein EHS24_007351 [Apiotrichum porosum]|uniref:Extracellular membrane protein CFEM domain-containing protein n=1 Tax=Apiotrichum porosum TaxID=105984 RepID=A0A427XU42_9TREE|nr:uncharacterized protein EHS24_007351 [Apiotrichum porosum]RSH82384.1 hypothetical protein EHS24_007351 [Apiotrichum porosum]